MDTSSPPNPAPSLTSNRAAPLDQQPPAPLFVRTLGGFQVCVGVRQIDKAALRQRRSGELLALLLVSPGQILTLGQISAALCPQKTPHETLDFYRHAVFTLRRLLEQDLPGRNFPSRYLEVSEEQVCLRLPPGSRLDFACLEAFCKVGDWDAALTVYRGDFLPEHRYRYAGWAEDYRQRFSSYYQQALLEAAQRELARQNFPVALERATQLLAIEPWHEKAVWVGMQAALGLGERPAALRLYRKLAQNLSVELGISPGPDLQGLYNTISRP